MDWLKGTHIVTRPRVFRLLYLIVCLHNRLAPPPPIIYKLLTPLQAPCQSAQQGVGLRSSPQVLPPSDLFSAVTGWVGFVLAYWLYTRSRSSSRLRCDIFSCLYNANMLTPPPFYVFMRGAIAVLVGTSGTVRPLGAVAMVTAAAVYASACMLA
jgi:hypothetical protein